LIHRPTGASVKRRDEKAGEVKRRNPVRENRKGKGGRAEKNGQRLGGKLEGRWMGEIRKSTGKKKHSAEEAQNHH